MNVKRKNGGPGITYLVNDGSLDPSSLSGYQVIVVGECHGNEDDEDLVRALITTVNLDYVLVEALADLVLGSDTDKRLQNNVPVDQLYYMDLTKRWIKLSMEFKTPFIGIEYTEMNDELSLKDSFEERERHFLKMIDRYRTDTNRIIVVVGDTHLRTIKTLQLGPVSPLYVRYNGRTDSVVIRSEYGEIH